MEEMREITCKVIRDSSEKSIPKFCNMTFAILIW